MRNIQVLDLLGIIVLVTLPQCLMGAQYHSGNIQADEQSETPKSRILSNVSPELFASQHHKKLEHGKCLYNIDCGSNEQCADREGCHDCCDYETEDCIRACCGVCEARQEDESDEECDFTLIYDFNEGSNRALDHGEKLFADMERSCTSTYETIQEKIHEVEHEVETEEVAYNTSQSEFLGDAQDEIQGLIDTCESNLEAATTRQERLLIKDECDLTYVEAYERQRMEMYEAEALYRSQLTAIEEELEEMIDDLEATVGPMDDTVFESLVPTAYGLQQDLEKELEEVREKISTIRIYFSTSICCNYQGLYFDKMNSDEIKTFEAGFGHCYILAHFMNGYSNEVYEGDVDTVGHGVSVTSSHTRPRPGGVRTGHTAPSGYYCSTCTSPTCGYGCKKNSAPDSGWRRNLDSEHNPTEPAHGEEGDDGEKIKRDFEECMLDWSVRKISRVFPYGLIEGIQCIPCTLSECDAHQ